MEIIYSLKTLNECTKQIETLQALILSICNELEISVNNTGTQTYLYEGLSKKDFTITIHVELPQDEINNLLTNTQTHSEFLQNIATQNTELGMSDSMEEYYQKVRLEGTEQLKEYTALNALVGALNDFYPLNIKAIAVARKESQSAELN